MLAAINVHRLQTCAIASPFRRVKMSCSSVESVKAAKTIKLKPLDATPASFASFGQVITACHDGQEFGPQDAQLDLQHGIPRFYIMHIEDRELSFSEITHHASVTQCLGSASGEEWYLGVAKPSILEGAEFNNGDLKTPTLSICGHTYVPPHPDDVYMFRVTGAKFLKLNRGTWHAGPLFKRKSMDFYNLELSDTNVVDHTKHDFLKEDGVVFLVEDD